MVAAMAMVADVPYTQARVRAVNMAGFDGKVGMIFTDAQPVLSDLGVAASLHKQGSHWSSLPDRAIIAVEESNRSAHAVVFDRNEKGEEYLYDWRQSGPVRRSETKYKLMGGDEYLDLT